MVTLKEIANAVGVSTATVSRVLNFDQTLSITARKRQAIIEPAEAMNYATPRARNRANQQGLNKVAQVHFLRPEQEFIDLFFVGGGRGGGGGGRAGGGGAGGGGRAGGRPEAARLQ